MSSYTLLFRALFKVANFYTTPRAPLDYGRLFNPVLGSREVRGKVVSTKLTSDKSAVELTIKPGFGFNAVFTPGQYIGIGVNINGQWRWRSYSLTNPPLAEHNLLTFFIKRNDDGVVSNYVIDTIQLGDIVRLSKPAGEFILPDPLPEKILFITAGSGITPVISMLRSIIGSHANSSVDIAHIHSEHRKDTFPFYEELEALDDSIKNYHLHFMETSAHGRIALPADLNRLVPDWAQRSTWACGNNELLKILRDVYTNAGISDKLFVEKFSIDRSQFSTNGGKVKYLPSNTEFDCKPGQSILEGALSSGVLLPSGCRIGICHTCMLVLDDGNSVDLENGAIADPGQRIRTCVSTPLGDIRIDG